MPLIRVSISTRIKASPEAVFAFVTDTSNMPLWNSGMTEITPQARLAEGMSYHSTTRVMGHEVESENRVERLVTNRELIISNTRPPLTYQATFRFKGDEAQTMLTCDLDMRGASSIIHLAKPVLEYLAQTRLEADFNTLKAIVEAESAVVS